MASEAKRNMRTGNTVEKKGDAKNSIFRFLVAFILILLYVLLLIYLLTDFRRFLPYTASAILSAAFIVCLFVYGSRVSPTYRLSWVIMIMAFPLPGIILWLLMGRTRRGDRLKDRFAAIERKMQGILKQDEELLESLAEKDPAAANQFRYVLKQTKMPVIRNTDVMYYSGAAEAFKALTGALQMARKFIFMEYHAIENAESFAKIRSILAEKAKEGVEIRILYDDVGSGSFLSSGFISRMKAIGCRCRVFHTAMPFITIFRNNRDNRKFTVIDGRVGFVGSYNLSNECFHVTEPFGNWKDTGVGLAGEAARHLSLLFLQMWNLAGETDSAMDYDKYIPEFTYDSREEGYIQPFGTGPLAEEQTAEEICMNLLRSARRYAWFTTPSLMISDELLREMTGAAGRGVDVRIITPGIPDKKLVHRVTRAGYPGLIRGGVRIFEYTPGFIHSGMCLTDDSTAMIGTMSLSQRSFSRYFEDGVLLHRCRLIPKMAADFRKMYKESREITAAEIGNRGFFTRLGQGFLRLAGPLL